MKFLYEAQSEWSLPHDFSIDGECALGDRTPAIALDHYFASSCFVRTGQGARRRLANAIR